MESFLLSSVFEVMGYKGFEDFFNDNSGAVDLILIYIQQNFPDIDLDDFL